MSPRTSILVSLLLAGPLGPAPAATAQPFFRLADVNTRVSSFGWSSTRYEDRLAAPLGGELFFVADDPMSGRELWKTDGTDDGTVQVRDICPGTCGSSPRSLVAAGGILYFVAGDGSHGDELWRTDGTADGTWLVHDVQPGPADGTFAPLLAAGGTLFFAGDDGLSGREPWVSDGSPGGTRLLRDIRPGPDGSAAVPRAAAPGRLLLAADEGVHGLEPWTSDGTPAGTHLLADLRSGPFSSTSSSATEEWFVGDGGLLLLTAFDGALSGLWASREEAADLVLLASSQRLSGTAHSFVELGSAVVFGTLGGLWKTDGTPAGTVLLKNLQPSPLGLVRLGGRIYFGAGDAGHGRELWTSDGTPAGTLLVKDVRPGPASGLSGDRSALLAAGGELRFLATVDSGAGPTAAIWRSDGTEAGTVPAVDLGPGLAAEFLPAGSPVPVGPLAAAADQLYLWVYASGYLQLWRWDGTPDDPHPLLVPRLTHSDPDPRTPGPHRGRLLFSANDGLSGQEPWVTDGSAAGLRQLADAAPEPGARPRVEAGQPLGGSAFFIANDRIWKTDGTPEGTEGLDPAGVRSLTELTRFGDHLFFIANHPVLGRALFRSDGTAAGTELFADPHPGPPVVLPIPPVTRPTLDGILWELTPLRGTLYFAGGSGDFLHNMDITLWKSDGTPAGTGPVTAVSAPDRPSILTAAGDTLFFFASSPQEGMELWRSDGTPGGTRMVQDILPGIRSGAAGGRLVPVGGTVFFAADDGSTGAELWRSDGTADGTFLVADLAAGAAGSEPFPAASFHGLLFFTADDGVHGRELWVSDGTPGGARLVKDIHPGEAGSVPFWFLDLGTRLLFTADDGVHGHEVWQTDGTASGTFLVQDVAPGPASADPAALITAGAFLYFTADDGAAGRELWGAPRAQLGPAFADVPPAHWAWPWIETLAYAGLAGGCGFGEFCPERPVTRGEAAVFLVQASHEPGSAPPRATGARFADVPAGHWAADWIEQLAADGVTAGCGGGSYCPDRPLTRAELAVLLLRARHGPAFLPAPATGAVFADVPAGHWAAAWIEQLAAEGLTGGCAAGLFCPDRTVTRAEMAVFLTSSFPLF